MIISLLALILSVKADPLAASFRVRFTPPRVGKVCELQLFQNTEPEYENRPSHFVKVVFPWKTRSKSLGALLNMALGKLIRIEDGRAFVMVECGKKNVLDGTYGWTLRRALGRAESTAFPEFTLEAEKYLSTWSAENRALAEDALQVLERKIPGELISVDYQLPMAQGACVQGQTVKLVLPERTSPRGILVAESIRLPTHEYLTGFTYRAGDLGGWADHGAAVLPIEVLSIIE